MRYVTSFLQYELSFFSPGSIQVNFVTTMKQPEGQTVTEVYERMVQAIIASPDQLTGVTTLDDISKVTVTIGNLYVSKYECQCCSS